MPSQIDLPVPPSASGVRLDAFIAEALGISRRYVHRLIARGGLRYNGTPAAKGAILRAGDQIQVDPFRHPSEGPRAVADPDLTVIRQADGLLAVDKPAGAPTHPLDFDEVGTVLNALLARCPETLGVGEGGLRSGVVHRLDTFTSGVQVFATEEEAWQRARRAFNERLVRKRYVARVHGHLGGEHELALRLESRGRRMRPVAHGGKPAISHIRELTGDEHSTLVEVFPLTGLRHQIRVTLAHLGHPVIGDRLYGSDRNLSRHLLHAVEIDIEGFTATSSAPPEIVEASGADAGEPGTGPG